MQWRMKYRPVPKYQNVRRCGFKTCPNGKVRCSGVDGQRLTININRNGNDHWDTVRGAVCHATNIYKQERRLGLMFPNADNTILA